MTEMTTIRIKDNFPTNAQQASEVYSCNSHAYKVVHNLGQLRQGSHFCDVEIVAGNKVFKAHRAVLAASSPYFMAMFVGGLCESDQSSVELHSVSSSVFECLLDFMYSGRVSINEGNVQKVMVAADMLELSDVVMSCSQFLLKVMRPFNVVGIYRLVDFLVVIRLEFLCVNAFVLCICQMSCFVCMNL